MANQPANSRPRPRRARRWLFRLVAVGAALTLAFIVGEIAVRLVVGSPLPERLPLVQVEPHPRRAWTMTPHHDHYTYQHPVRVNALGLRGGEVEAKQPGEVRVIALGDSLVYGQGVAEEDTLPAQLESRLNAGGDKDSARKYSVINAGVRGYSTGQEMDLLAELRDKVEPDIVVLFWYWNDLKETEVRDNYLILKQLGPVPFDTLYPIEGWKNKTRWHVKQTLRRSALVMYVYDLYQTARAPGPPPGMVEQGLKSADQHLAKLARMGAKHGFQPYVAIIPDANTITGEHESTAYADKVESLAKAHGLPVIRLRDTLRDLHNKTDRLPVVPFDGHYDGSANKAMAQSVAESIRNDEDKE